MLTHVTSVVKPVHTFMTQYIKVSTYQYVTYVHFFTPARKYEENLSNTNIIFGTYSTYQYVAYFGLKISLKHKKVEPMMFYSLNCGYF